MVTSMDKTNIVYEDLCIKKIISVIKSNNSHHHKLIKVNGRHSDAFVYVICGSCTYRFDDGIEFSANEGDVFYLPHQSVYTMFIHSEDYKFIFCDFEFAETSTRCAALYPRQRSANTDNLFFRLLNRYRSPTDNTYAECMSLLYSIYGVLQQNADGAYLDKDKRNDMAEAKSYIDEHFSQSELSVSTLAQKINISEVYFRKLFKAQYGIQPSRYLTSVRLKNAKRLMKYPFMTLDECALQSGFSSVQYFCRIFKKETGISPGKYRKGL